MKFVLLISFILLLTFACIALFLFHHQREILCSDLRTLSVSLSRNLSANSVYDLLTRNTHNLSGLLDSLSNYEDVMFAWVKVTVSAHAKRNGTVQIQVADTGQGIHQQHLSHLFEPFYQAHKGSGAPDWACP